MTNEQLRMYLDMLLTLFNDRLATLNDVLASSTELPQEQGWEYVGDPDNFHYVVPFAKREKSDDWVSKDTGRVIALEEMRGFGEKLNDAIEMLEADR